MTVKEIFYLPSPEKEVRLKDVVRWVFENEDEDVIAHSLLSRDEICRGVAPPQLDLDECLENNTLYRIAFNFQEGYDNEHY